LQLVPAAALVPAEPPPAAGAVRALPADDQNRAVWHGGKRRERRPVRADLVQLAPGPVGAAGRRRRGWHKGAGRHKLHAGAGRIEADRLADRFKQMEHGTLLKYNDGAPGPIVAEN
jgi:hypothetical protein